jgi:hypothetical protein
VLATQNVCVRTVGWNLAVYVSKIQGILNHPVCNRNLALFFPQKLNLTTRKIMETQREAQCARCDPFLTLNMDPPQDLIQNNRVVFHVEKPVKAYAMRFQIKKDHRHRDRTLHFFSNVVLQSNGKVLYQGKLDNDMEVEPLFGYIPVKCVFDKDGYFGKELSGEVSITFVPEEQLQYKHLLLGKVVFDVDEYRYYYQMQREYQRGEMARDTISTLRRQVRRQKDARDDTFLIIVILSVVCGLMAISLLAVLFWTPSAKMKSITTPF